MVPKPMYDPDPSEQQRKLWEAEQLALQTRIIPDDHLDFDPETLEGLRYIAGVDLSFFPDTVDKAVACLSVLEWPSLSVVHTAFLTTELRLPYIAGLLAFREVQPLLELLDELKRQKPQIYPQVILVDGNGRLHPRKCGVACHLGVLANVPTIGVAKNFLCIYEDGLTMVEVKQTCRSVLQKRGDYHILRGAKTGTVYGAAQRTTDEAPNPVFVSQGHRISLETALKIVLATCRFRVPEPVRRADQDSRTQIRMRQT